VTDDAAPLYSKIILQPMDFLTMRKKLEGGEYPDLQPFKDDFILLCRNTVIYNEADSPFTEFAIAMCVHPFCSFAGFFQFISFCL
jgi:hypothetical protein